MHPRRRVRSALIVPRSWVVVMFNFVDCVRKKVGMVGEGMMEEMVGKKVVNGSEGR